MNIARLDGIDLHYREDGDPDGPPVVFANSLGTDFRLWDHVVGLLPKSLRLIRYDKRGHGLSECPKAPYTMGSLVSDVEKLMERLAVRDAAFVGLSIGGLIAQGIAAKRMDLVRAMVLSNTGAKIGTREIWDDRIATARAEGMASLVDATMDRWFSKAFQKTDEFVAWRNSFERQVLEGYIGCSQAISGTDMITPTSGLTLPTLGIAGSEDKATPPDLVRETTDLVRGSRFHLVRGAGHLPCVEKPGEYAEVLTGFLRDIGHL